MKIPAVKIPARIPALMILAVVLLACCLYVPTLAYQTDATQKMAAAQAGTVEIGGPDLKFLPVDPAKSEPVVSGPHLTVWNPGDINTLHWEIENLGTKSVDLCYTLNIYWNEGPGLAATDDETAGSELWSEAPFVYLYPATMSDAAITADLNAATPSQFIAIGTSNVQLTNAVGSTRYGYTYTFIGEVIDGIGANGETGDATIPGATSTVEEFKIALSPHAPASYMDRHLVFELKVGAKQHRNTTGSDWGLVETQATQ